MKRSERELERVMTSDAVLTRANAFIEESLSQPGSAQARSDRFRRLQNFEAIAQWTGESLGADRMQLAQAQRAARSRRERSYEIGPQFSLCKPGEKPLTWRVSRTFRGFVSDFIEGKLKKTPFATKKLWLQLCEHLRSEFDPEAGFSGIDRSQTIAVCLPLKTKSGAASRKQGRETSTFSEFQKICTAETKTSPVLG